MNRFSIAALVTIAAAQEVPPEFFDENPRRELADDLADIDNQEDCEAKVSIAPYWYSYVWNSEDCRCEHTWTSAFSYDDPEGYVRNPFYVAGTGQDVWITESDFNALPTCPETPDPVDGGGDEDDGPGFASVYLKNNKKAGVNSVSGFETGVL